MKKSFVFIIFILFGLNFFGQGEVNVFQQDSIIADTIKITTKIEGSVFGGGGLSTYLYNPKVGSTNLGLGVIAGFEATFWRDNIGFTTGLHYNSYTSKYSIDNTTLYTPSRDYDTYDAKPREDFNLRTEYSGYSEQITSHYFGIPFMLSYKKVFDNNVRLNTGGGFKLSYLMSSKSVNKGNFSAFGDYSQARGVNASRITDGPGFETYSGEDFEVENNFGIGASGIATFDVGYAFSDDFILFGGPYLEYQFFGAGTDDKYLNNYVASDMLTATVDYQGVSNSNLVDNMNRFALGFKVGVTFTLRGKRYIVKEIKYRAIVVEKEIEDPDKNLKQAQSWYEMSDSLIV